MRGMCTEKNRTLTLLGAQKITFSPKPDRRRDISNYRVALLLKKDNPHENEARQIKILHTN